MSLRRPLLPQVWGLAALLLCGLVLAACGNSGDDETSVPEGESVNLGGLRYTVLFSRFLNPGDVEDSYYLTGQPQPKSDQLYLGVFISVKNVSNAEAKLPRKFTLTDTQQDTYGSLPSASNYAFPGGTNLADDTEVPDPDSPAGSGPVQGSLVLFKVPDAVTENRPLTMRIPGEGGPAEVELDI